MKTIPRNSKRAREVLEKAQGVKVYSLANYFNGEPLVADPIDPVAWSKGELVPTTPSAYLRGLLSVYGFAKLQDGGDGTFTLRVHSNMWYTFTNPS